MQNTTTQPQNFYTQPTMPAAAPQPIGQTEMPKKGGKMKPKQLLAVVGLVLFVIVAAMGILIAQRQVAGPGEDVTPVAPTAPESEPAASTYEPNNCVTIFNVPAPFADCASKVALTDFTNAGGKTIPVGSDFNVGDQFVFSLSVSNPGEGTVQNAKLIDNLPNSLQFVSGPTNPPYTITNNGQTVTATIPQVGPKSTVKVEFKVVVTAANYGSNTNSAYVENLNLEKPDKMCSYDFITLEGVTECVDKTLVDTRGRLIPNGGALTRGQRYEYRVTAKATNRSLGEVKVHDVLPEELDYIGPAAGSEKYITNDPNSGILIANFGVLEDEEATLGFIVEVPDDIEPTEFTNKALVYAFPPTSRQPEPPSNADECSISHTILPIGTAECVEKEAFTVNGTEIASGSDITPGQEFTYRITVLAEQTTTGPVVLVDELPRDIRYVEDPSNTPGIVESPEGTLTLNLGTMTSGQEEVVEFRVQLVANPQEETFRNVAIVTTDGDVKHTCELPLDVEKDYSCNSECDTNENCATIGSGYICYTTSSGNFCRLASNPTNVSCQNPTPTPTPTPPPTGTPTPTPPPTGTPTPTPTPAPGCNDLCVQNADCSNSSHICVTTDDGSMRCRLADYPSSSTCTIPTVAEQPVLPQELPQTGPADWLNWLKAGLVTLGIGTALFLLL